MFKIDRADNCIWLHDKRDPNHQQTIHMVPSQATAIADALREAAQADGEYHGEIPVHIAR